MISKVLDCLIPGDASLGMPPASQIDFSAYQLKYQIDELVGDFLVQIETLSLEKHGNKFIELDEIQCLSVINTLKTKNIRLFVAFLSNCFRAYYTDKTVLSLLSVGSVPPFPRGNVLEQDDWGLLEPVYERGPVYRVTPEKF